MKPAIASSSTAKQKNTPEGINLKDIVTPFESDEEKDWALDFFIEFLEKSKGPIYGETMSFSWMNNPNFVNIMEKTLKHRKVKMFLIVSEKYTDPEHINTLRKWGAEVEVIPDGKIDFSYVPKSFKTVFTNDYFIDSKRLIFSYPHNPDDKKHKHKGFLCEHNKPVYKCFKNAQTIWKQVKNRKDMPARFDFIERVLNDYYFEINKKTILEQLKEKFILIVGGRMHKIFENEDDAIKEIRALWNDEQLKWADKIFWEVSDYDKTYTTKM